MPDTVTMNPLQCWTCGKRFLNAQRLNYHIVNSYRLCDEWKNRAK